MFKVRKSSIDEINLDALLNPNTNFIPTSVAEAEASIASKDLSRRQGAHWKIHWNICWKSAICGFQRICQQFWDSKGNNCEVPCDCWVSQQSSTCECVQFMKAIRAKSPFAGHANQLVTASLPRGQKSYIYIHIYHTSPTSSNVIVICNVLPSWQITYPPTPTFLWNQVADGLAAQQNETDPGVWRQRFGTWS